MLLYHRVLWRRYRRETGHGPCMVKRKTIMACCLGVVSSQCTCSPLRCRPTIMLTSCFVSCGFSPGDTHMLQAFPAHSMPKALERRDRFCDDQRHGRGYGMTQERSSDCHAKPSMRSLSETARAMRLVFPQVYGPCVWQVVCGERERYHEAAEAKMTKTKGEADGHQPLRRRNRSYF